jgi:CBS domain-containing protein
MKVEQLMTKRVATCASGDTLNEVARIMWECDCGIVPIVEEGATPHVIGVVTDRDACMAAYTRGQPLWQIPVRDVMSTGVVSCRAGEDIHAAEQTMRHAQVHRLPVVDDADQILGVISLTDIACEAARELGARHQEVTALEIGETLVAIRKPRAIATVSA